MEPQENVRRELESGMKDLFEQAHRDPELKRQLLNNPREVAERFKLKFSDEEVQQLQKLGALTELAEEIKYGRLFPRPPIFYPIDLWRIQELDAIIGHLVVGPGPGPIFYPAEGFGQGFKVAMRAYNPGWVTYPGPGDKGGGTGGTVGGGSIGGGIVPGPIFYPAGLRNLLRARLAQILQMRQRFGR